MQHEVLRPGFDDRSVSDTTTDISQDARAEPATPARQSEPQGEDATPPSETNSPTEAPGETQEAEPATRPPIAPPRSWTKDRAEHWAKLDPGTQEFLLEQDRKASEAVRRSQNELADERNAVKAQREAAEKVRQQFEAKLNAPVTSVALVEEKMRAEFGDLNNTRDLEIMQQQDPFRFSRWQFLQTEWAGANAEHQAIEQRQQHDRQSKRSSYEAEQNKLLIEMVPEMAEPNKAAVLRERAIVMLNSDLGLSNDQLGRWMRDDTGHEILSNAGIQKLMADGLKYRDILSAPKAVVKSDLPPVQRPGVARAHGSDRAALVQSLTDKLSNSGSEKDALELLIAKRASRRAS